MLAGFRDPRLKGTHPCIPLTTARVVRIRLEITARVKVVGGFEPHEQSCTELPDLHAMNSDGPKCTDYFRPHGLMMPAVLVDDLEVAFQIECLRKALHGSDLAGRDGTEAFRIAVCRTAIGPTASFRMIEFVTGVLPYLVVTAARAAQARVFETLLHERERAGDLRGIRWSVLADPQGRRIGSGTATALALLHVLRGDAMTGATVTRRLRSQRVFIIHSGGDSRRLPAFAAIGKAFAPVASLRASGRTASIFDHVLDDLLTLPASEAGDVIVASGDAVVGAGREGIALHGAGVVGIAQRAAVLRGSKHGVYVVDARGHVRDFLQKPSEAAARAAGAIRRDRTVMIDTGIVRFDPQAAESLLRGFGVETKTLRVRPRGLLALATVGRAGPIDLYDHVLGAFVPGRSPRDYAARYGELRGPLQTLRSACARTPFTIRRSTGERFLHIGSTRECLDLYLRDKATSRAFQLDPPTTGVRQLASAGCAVTAGRHATAAIVNCVGTRIRVTGENLIVGMNEVPHVELPRGWGCVALPIGPRRWTTVLFHVDDDGKTPLAAGGTFGGARFARWCDDHSINQRTFGSSGMTIWEAPLWTVEAVPTPPTWMTRPSAAPATWRRARRYSVAQLLDAVDPERLVAHDAAIARRSVTDDPVAAFRDNGSLGVAALRAHATAKELSSTAAVLSRAAHAAHGASPFIRARLLAVAARLTRDMHPRAAARLLNDALTSVGAAVADEIELSRQPPVAAIRPDETVWTSAPARIDLAGGWSDTPPICHERGGAVVNLAIDLDGRPPVHAIAKLTADPVIRLHSVDLGLTRVFRTSAQLFDHRDPHDWSALAKAALRLAGIAPPRPSMRLDRWLSSFGGGLSLAMLAAVPKGSGLGTSSILGATVLACLDRVTGRNVTSDRLIERTSALEQMIATRGGWQDQIGGIEPGCKIARSEPGTPQRLRIEHIDLTPAFQRELSDHAVLCFTGVRRMARDILQRVVERYLVRDADMLGTIAGLKQNAESMRMALQAGDLDAFARELHVCRTLKTRIDPLATTPAIEAMVAPLGRQLRAWALPGAGGGGFFFFVARSPRDARAIRARFAASPPHPLARTVDWSIALRGIRCGSV